MAIKQILRQSLSRGKEATSMSTKVPKGYLVVYVGEEEKKRFVVPISYLNEPDFQELLSMAEEEFGYNHPMGVLTIPCREDIFVLKDLNTSLTKKLKLLSEGAKVTTCKGSKEQPSNLVFGLKKISLLKHLSQRGRRTAGKKFKFLHLLA